VKHAPIEIYRFRFIYDDSESPLAKESSGRTLNEAAEKLKYQYRHLGEIKIISIEKL
jgi:hypothetical protein